MSLGSPSTSLKRAKDIGSAAVMLALINVVFVWVCVLLG